MGKELIFIVSAPSGAGKTTLVRRVMEQLPDLRFSVSYTTRPPRASERDGQDYFFVSDDVFDQMIQAGEFLEWAEVLGNRYGTARSQVEALRTAGFDLVLDVDTQGAKRVRSKVDRAVSIYIFPPSLRALRERLINRRLDPPKMIEFRLANARKDMEEAYRYDYVIVNDELDAAAEKLKAIIIAERCRNRDENSIRTKLKEWEEIWQE